jgi:signal transduction histidine kinase/DNA-binding response OmpR family regulator
VRTRVNDLPIRLKVLGSTVAVLAASWLFVLAYYPRREERAQMAAAEQRASSTAQMLALAVGVGFELNDYGAIKGALDWAKQDPALAYALVLDSSGAVFATYNPKGLSVGTAVPGAPSSVRNTGAVLEAVAPISIRGHSHGALVLGTSLSPTREAITRLRVTSIAVGLAALLCGALVAFYGADRITRPLTDLRRAADAIAAGRYEVEVRGGSGDEVGALASALRTMVERVREAVAQLTTQAKELTLARDGAAAANRAKSSFLANMSHEIRTPMNAVLGFTELVLDTELTAEQRRSLELVHSSSEALLTILNDILDYSKIEAEHLKLESIPFDLPKVIHATATLLAVRAREKHLELIVDVPPDVPHLVRGDPTRLRQVLVNLIGNAVKFTETGEVAASASVVERDTNRALVQFRVRDTGIGISADAQTDIFQEFTQADASMTRRFGGTGLGLAISLRLARLMGGELTVTSEVGRGSEFSFTLGFPLEASAPATVVRGRVASLSGRRLLVVDDNETNRRILRDMLGAEGIAVQEARGAEAGLEALRRAKGEGVPYDLVILDAQMPERDGFQLAADVRADPEIADTRLLMLTSAGQRGDGERCRQLGVQAYLTKPIARADLIEAVGIVLVAASSTGGARDVITRHSIAESRHTLRILLAEDNLVNQQVAMAMLVKRGHQVDVVGNGREAVDAITARAYDLVLMDIQMPEMDGFEATAVIRALPRGRTLPIIALTAHALAGDRERCLAAGMNGYLTKPFKAHELFAAVERGVVGAGASPPVDLAAFRATMREAGAEDAVEGILDTFVEHAGGHVDALERATMSGNAEAIATAAHAFKSAAGSIRAGGLAGALQAVEQAGRAGAVETARHEWKRAREEVEAVVTFVRAARELKTSHG